MIRRSFRQDARRLPQLNVPWHKINELLVKDSIGGELAVIEEAEFKKRQDELRARWQLSDKKKPIVLRPRASGPRTAVVGQFGQLGQLPRGTHHD
jgi:hypothetical protein